jgi:hypothetical protein
MNEDGPNGELSDKRNIRISAVASTAFFTAVSKPPALPSKLRDCLVKDRLLFR